MGRPLKKDVNGVNVIRSFTGAEPGIRVQAYFLGALSQDYQIVKQRGSRTFAVYGSTNFTDDQSQGSLVGTRVLVGKLVENEPAANGEIRIQGHLSSNSGQLVSIAKLTKRMATDFSGNKYKWRLENDSSNDYIVLTAI